MEVFLAVPSYADAAEKSTSVSYSTVDTTTGAITSSKANQLQAKTYSATKETYNYTDSDFYEIAIRIVTILINAFLIEYCVWVLYVAAGLAFSIFLYRYLVKGKDPRHHEMRPGNRKSIKNCLTVIIALTSCKLVFVLLYILFLAFCISIISLL